MRKAFNEYGRILILVAIIGFTLFFIFGGLWFGSIADATDDSMPDVELNDIQSRAAPIIYCQDQSAVVGSEVNIGELVSAINADGEDISDKISVVCSSPRNYNKETKIFKTTDSSEAGVYYFTLTVVDKSSDYNLKTTKKMTITVDNSIGQYSIMIATVKNGILKTNSKTGFEFKDTTVTLIATPDAGYRYDGATLKYIIGNKEEVKELSAETASFVMPGANVILTPKWAPADYTVAFEPNEGVIDVESKLVTFGDEYGELPTPTKAGYVLDGWYTENNGQGEKILSTSKVTQSSNHILYAYWVPATYKLVFDANGGVCAIESKNVTFRKTVGELPTPIKAGYNFDGWVLPNGKNMHSSFVYTYATDMTVKAQWSSAKFTVTLDANNGTCNPNTIEVIYGGKYGELPTPKRTGYNFVGWYDSLNGGNQITETTVVSKTDIHTLYARYIPQSCTITLNPNGGNCSEVVLVREYDSKYGELPVPTKFGYDFVGWSIESPTSGKLITKDSTVNGNRTLFATWKSATPTVTFDANGGSCTLLNKTVTYGDIYGNLPTPIKNGYYFNGWHINSANGPLVLRNTKVTTDEDHTLVAAWSTTASYTINFDANGGTCSILSYKRAFGENYGTLPVPTRAGYIFNGWYTQRSGGTKASIATVCTGDTYLYAQWTANTYTVNYVYYNNSESMVLKSVKLKYGEKYSGFPEITKNKEHFVGWYTDEVDGELITEDSIVSIASNHSLYTRFTQAGITVTFDPLGGTCDTISRLVTVGYPYGVLPTPEKDGYNFEGWVAAVSPEKFVNEDTIVTIDEDHTLEAVWSGKVYPIVLNLNYPDAPTYPIGFEAKHGDPFNVLPEPERPGYTFEGWYREPDLKNKVTSSTIFYYTDGTELYAKWNSKEYIVSVYAFPDDNEPAVQFPVKYGEPYGSAFYDYSCIYEDSSGFFLEPEFINEVTPETIVSIAADHNLYAKYTITMTVDFDLNYEGAPNYSETITVSANEKYGPLPTPTRDGYIFAGWYLGTGRLVTEDSIVSKAIEHTLYADWVSAEYSSIYFTDKTEAETMAASYDDTFYVVNGNPRTQKIDNKIYYVVYDIHTALGSYADNKSIEKIIIAKTVKSFDQNVFTNCTNLTSITMPLTIKIESPMFTGCNKVTDLTVTRGDSGSAIINSPSPEFSEKSYPWLFTENGVEKHIVVTIENDVQMVPNYMFYSTGKIVIDELTVPVGIGAADDPMEQYKDELGNRSIVIKKLHLTTRASGVNRIPSYQNLDGSLNTHYRKTLWYDTEVETLIIDDGVTSIGNYAFVSLSTKTLVMPINATLYKNAFSGVNTIKTFIFTPGVDNESYGQKRGVGADYLSTSADTNTYSKTPWYSANKTDGFEVILDPEITYIGNYMFMNSSKLNSINLENVTSLGTKALYFTNPKTIVINDDIESIGEQALRFSSVQNLSLPVDIELYQGGTTPDYITSSTPVKLTLTAGKTGIGKDYYQEEYIASPWGHLTVSELNIGDGVTRIGDFAFFDTMYYDTNLDHQYTFTYLNTNNVTEIGDYAFNGCSIKTLVIGDKIESIGQFVFEGCPVADLTVPIDYGFERSSVFGESPCFSKIHFTAGKTGIGFDYDQDITIRNTRTPWYLSSSVNPNSPIEVTFADNVSTINNYMFANCKSLQRVNLNNVVVVGRNAFYNCTNCEFLADEGNAFAKLEAIGIDAFYGCLAITEVNLERAGLRSVGKTPIGTIGGRAFGNSGITKLTIGSYITSVSQYCFIDCNNLQAVIIPANVNTINGSAFSKCESLEGVFIVKNALSATVKSGIFEGSNENLIIYLEGSSLDASYCHASWNINGSGGKYTVKTNQSLATFKNTFGL